MKKVLFPVLALLLITACQKENVATVATTAINATIDERTGNQVSVCHNGNIIEISINALPAHLAHGDVQVIDEDGDGWATAVSECMPGIDCDDNDASVQEDCCNYHCINQETLDGGSNWIAYYDSEINNCEGIYDFASVECPQFLAYAHSLDPENHVIVFQSYVSDYSCEAYVGEGEGYISQADFDCTMALLRAFIAAHPEIPNYCDVANGLNSSDGSNNLARPEELMKNLMPEKIRKQLDKQ